MLVLIYLGLFVAFCCIQKSQSDIRKWFMKSHEKGSKPAKSAEPQSSASKAQPEKTVSLVLSYCPLSYFLALHF